MSGRIGTAEIVNAEGTVVPPPGTVADMVKRETLGTRHRMRKLIKCQIPPLHPPQ